MIIIKALGISIKTVYIRRSFKKEYQIMSWEKFSPYDKKTIIRTRKYVIKNMQKELGITVLSQLVKFNKNKSHLVSHFDG